MTYRGDSSPLGGASAVPERWQAAIAPHNPADAAAIVGAYQTFAPATGLSADLALAQAMLETGWATSAAYRTRHNLAGIGITGDNVAGPQFNDLATGVKAHLELLNEYFGDGNDRWGVLNAYRLGFSHPLGLHVLTDMNGKWAFPGTTYGQSIATWANAVVGAEPAPGPVATGVAAGRIADEALRHRDEQRSGSYDPVNGDHPNYLWCLAFVDNVHVHSGVDVVRRTTAADKGRALLAQGYMHADGSNPPRGAVVVWDERFWAGGGHIAISLGDGTFVGTCSPEGIGVRSGWYGNSGFLGWAYYPGVVAESAPPAPVPPPDVIFAPKGAPTKLDGGSQGHLWEYANVGRAGAARIEPLNAAGVPTGFYRAWCADLMGGGPAGRPWGVALSQEYDLPGGRRCQDFSNGVATAIRQADGAWMIWFN